MSHKRQPDLLTYRPEHVDVNGHELRQWCSYAGVWVDRMEFVTNSTYRLHLTWLDGRTLLTIPDAGDVAVVAGTVTVQDATPPVQLASVSHDGKQQNLFDL